MTLKEELEILRGEPIKVFTGDSMDIPCIETSDPEKLCEHPVVSVNMITYNHEPYIRQAIEGVMMQKTDFEFELVIGEDASTDKTREICFEYQKRYPDKIRVLWWHENLYRNPHPAGGNSRRVSARCRGEFIALCEGDDYWIDPLKLQKQVDVMRKHPNVGFCFTGAKIFTQATGAWSIWNSEHRYMRPGLMRSIDYLCLTMFGGDRGCNSDIGPEFWQMTATFVARKKILKEAKSKYVIFNWRLLCGDSVFCLGCGSLCDVYYISDETAVYRRNPKGLTLTVGSKGMRDTLIVRMYYYFVLQQFSRFDFVHSTGWRLFLLYFNISDITMTMKDGIFYIDKLCRKYSRPKIGMVVWRMCFLRWVCQSSRRITPVWIRRFYRRVRCHGEYAKV